MGRPDPTALGIPDTPELREKEIELHAERLARELGEDEPTDEDHP